MKIMICMPHFFPVSGSKHPIQGSSQDTRSERVRSVEFCVKHLLAMLSRDAILLGTNTSGPGVIINTDVALHANRVSGELFICTHQDNHLLSDIGAAGYRHVSAAVADPMHLGYACRRLFARFKNDFDLFFYVEDDIVPMDPNFFDKFSYFQRLFGEDKVLLPQRYELFSTRSIKTYLDQPAPASYRVEPAFQGEPRLVCDAFGLKISFEATTSHGTGCYLISRGQLSRWIEQEDFLTLRAGTVMDPLEQAMVPMGGRLPMYKPARENLSYFEVHHVPNRLCHARTPVAKIREKLSGVAKTPSQDSPQATAILSAK